MSRNKTLNRFQKAARRPGECRVNAPEVRELIRLSESEDAKDRLLAASYLCPCHVRKHDEQAWEALFRMMEDPDARVRQRAWHTLEDGGGGGSPRVQEIAGRVWLNETDRQTRWLIEKVCGSRLQRQRLLDRTATATPIRTIGKCDFCGAPRVAVTERFDTPIPDGNATRAARICHACNS